MDPTPDHRSDEMRRADAANGEAEPVETGHEDVHEPEHAAPGGDRAEEDEG